MKKCVSEQFLDFTSKRYPALNNRAYRKLFLYLCFGTRQDNESQLLVIPHDQLASYCGKKGDPTHFNSGAFLERFRAEVLPDLEWTDYQSNPGLESWLGKCRAIAKDGFDEETKAMIAKELNSPPEENDKFYFHDGRRCNRSNKAVEKKIDLDQYLIDQQSFDLNESQSKIMNGLWEVSSNGRAFAQKLNDNLPLIEKAIDQIVLTPDDTMTLPEKKLHQRKVIESIKEDSRVFYKPTPLKRTSRLHHSSECVLSLKSAVRQAFCHGWTEVDLVSSQFVILANLLDAPIAKAFINSGDHLWSYLHQQATGETSKPGKVAKTLYKRIIYGICFGTSETELKRLLETNQAEKLASNPMIVELLERRAAWFRSIYDHKYITDIWGTRHYLEKAGWKTDIYGNKTYSKERWAGSLAATKIQSIELEMISSAFEVQEKYGASYWFQIMLFQHDGFTVSLNSKVKVEKVKELMQEALAAKAKEVGDQLQIDLSAMRYEFNDL